MPGSRKEVFIYLWHLRPCCSARPVKALNFAVTEQMVSALIVKLVMTYYSHCCLLTNVLCLFCMTRYISKFQLSVFKNVTVLLQPYVLFCMTIQLTICLLHINRYLYVLQPLCDLVFLCLILLHVKDAKHERYHCLSVCLPVCLFHCKVLDL